jgi:hypothetical protein
VKGLLDLVADAALRATAKCETAKAGWLLRRCILEAAAADFTRVFFAHEGLTRKDER